MRIITFLLIFFASSFSFGQNTVTIEGQQFFKSVQVNNETLIVNGGGLREKFWIDLYVAALYLKRKMSDANLVINKDEEMLISIKLVTSKVTTENFAETLREGFAKSSHGKASKEEIKKFISFFEGDFKMGDKLLFEYTPKGGIQITKNGIVKGSIPGLEFKKALFSIWLGDDPIDEGLKQKVLGK